MSHFFPLCLSPPLFILNINTPSPPQLRGEAVKYNVRTEVPPVRIGSLRPAP